MGPTKLVVPLSNNDLPPQPFLVAAHELLDQLYAETERLVLQKMTAVHYVARALIERDELIGDELEAVFGEAEAVDPTLARPYERKLIQFRTFAPMPSQPQAPEWQPRTGAAAASVAGAASGGAQGGGTGVEPGAAGVEPGAADTTWWPAPEESDELWPEPPAWFFDDPHTRWAPTSTGIDGAHSTE